MRDLFISKMKNVVLQDTLTFETFSPEEVLKRALKFEQSKQTTQAFQKTNATTASTVQVNGAAKIKQEPIMSIGNKNASGRRQANSGYKKKIADRKEGRSFADSKTCTRCGRIFGEGHLKKCSAMGKTCKNCSKANHFAKMCKSQQVNEITEKSSSSDEECNLIQSFELCEEFEIMSVESELSSLEEIDEYIKQQSNKNKETDKYRKDVQKVDIRRNTRSKQIRSLKALVRIDHQIINMTIDTGSPVSFLKWATAKTILESSKNTKFIPRENLNLTTKFVDYNKQPINILGAITTNIRSAGWEVVGASFLITKRPTRSLALVDKENLALKLSKCEFFQQEVNRLGHKLSSDGISPKITKTEAILKLSPPTSLKQHGSFLGSINHLAKFSPNAATLTEKLRPLLREENEKKKLKSVKIQVKKFEWKEEHSEIFESIKTAVANITKIHYYDPSLDTRVKCDASHSGLGASLEQQNVEGEWIPIAFAFRYLNTQEKNFPQMSLNCLQSYGRLTDLNTIC